jgi:DNA polymerase-3 subunit alpha
MNLPFVHLKVHSEFAIQDSLVRIKPLIAKCIAEQMPAIAITDPCNLFAAIKFYKATRAAGIKPIFGSELEFYDRANKTTFKVTALCKNNQGYLNLSHLISKAHLEKTDQDTCYVSLTELYNHADGLIILSGALDGDIGHAVNDNNIALAEDRLKQWLQYFPGNFYLEIQRIKRFGETEYIKHAVALSKKYNCPLVATNNVVFLEKEEFAAHEARLCINQGYVLGDSKRPKTITPEQRFKTDRVMRTLFKDIPSAITNTALIAQRCNFNFTLDKNFLPNYPIPAGYTLEEYIAHRAEAGLQKKIGTNKALATNLAKQKIYRDRLHYELQTINQMGFSGYFLIVADFVCWSKNNDVPVGPGRGSGAGSLVAYCLEITAVDPMEFDLLFERFLNPERVSLPDFDIDFCMEGRDRVIDYVTKKYGAACVAQIITYGTMAAKAVVRDVGRVLGNGYGFVDAIAKLIPFEIGMTLTKAIQQEELLARRYENEEEVKTLIDLALKLEGLTRNVGKHAGGVVIAPDDIEKFCPLYKDTSNAHPVTQLDKDDLESIGLVKFDFLGLRTLTIIKWALNTIYARKKLTTIDIDLIPRDDQASYKLLQDCNTTAVFQLESRGMKDLIKRLQPDCFEDIVALVALFRPGPLQSGMVDDFIDRKHGRAPLAYPHPLCEDILKPTYGIILYQEQVMQIAQVLAGYSLGAADLLRRAMGKKKPEEMAKQRSIFINGAKDNNIDEHAAASIFDLIEKFAGYGFNKSHSVAYALIAYQTAWLKAHYPAEFMAAVLSSDMDNTDKVVSFIHDCKALNLTLLPPDINKSTYAFSVPEENTIRFGLGAIKGVGQAVIDAIMQEREHGDFTDAFDLCARDRSRKINKKTLEALITAGAFDCFNTARSTMFANISTILAFAEQNYKNRNQLDLFAMDDTYGALKPEFITSNAWTKLESLIKEQETIGFYFSGHPIDYFAKELSCIISHKLMHISSLPDKTKVCVAAVLKGKRVIMTKRGKKLGILNIDDGSMDMEATMFGEALADMDVTIKKNDIIILQGEVTDDRFKETKKIIATKVISLQNFRKNNIKKIILAINAANQDLEALAQILDKFKHGSTPCYLRCNSDNTSTLLKLGSQYCLAINDDCIFALENYLGRENVEIVYA